MIECDWRLMAIKAQQGNHSSCLENSWFS